jgi:chemotaxis protein CheC
MNEELSGRSCTNSKGETTVNTFTDDRYPDKEILQELGNIGAGHAATSLSEILQQQINIDLPKIHSLPTHLVPKLYERHDSATTAVYMQLNGDSECDILLLFEREEAKKIASMMTLTTSLEDINPEMEKSAIQELANIVIGSFLSAISDFTGVKLMPTPPQLSTDCFDALIDSFLVKQSLLSDIAIIFDTQFKRTDGNVGGTLLLFPSRELQSVLVEKAKQWMDDATPKANGKSIECTSDGVVNISNAATPKKEIEREEG